MSVQKTWAMIIGIILLLVGILGFVMSSPLLGIFPVNTLHNVVHLVTGLIFVWAGFSSNMSMTKGTNQWLGVIYILVGIIGFFGVLGFLAISGGADPDNFLHLGIGIVSALIGWMAK